MLSSDDAQVAARDPRLIGLPILLDPRALLDSLRLRLGNENPSDIRCTYLRYKPRASCLASYQVQTSVGEVEIYAKTYGDPAKVRRRLRRPVASPLGPGEIILDDVGIHVCVFPSDVELRALSLLGSRERTHALLARLLPDYHSRSSYTIRRLAYKPERRCVVGVSKDHQPFAVIRFYTTEDFMRSTRNAKVLEGGPTLRLAKRLGRASRYKVAAVRWLEGRLLSESLAESSFDVKQLLSVGRAIAEFHAGSPYKLDKKRRREEAEALLEAADFAATVCPQLQDALRDLAGRLRQYLMERPKRRQAVHGDFYANQVLLRSDGVALLDLDEAYRGDCNADLGNFIGHLISHSLAGKLAPARVGLFREVLLEGYAAAGGIVKRTDVDHYTAAALLRLTAEPFRRRRNDWPSATAALVEEARALLSKGSSRAAGRSTLAPPESAVDDPFAVATDPQMPFLADAVNPVRVQRYLDTALPWPAQLRAVRVVRYKPQRRCLIEYDVEAGGELMTLVGKARAKHVDEHTYQLQRTLWQGAFGESSSDGIMVPQPLAILPPLHMWIARKAPGTAATEMLLRPDQPHLAQRIADAIFKLQQCGIRPRRSHTMDDELRILHERLPRVAESRPHLQLRIQRLLDQCERIGHSLPKVKTKPIHRDFHPDQLLIDGDCMYILDLDLFCEGDPALDLGNLTAHLAEYALRKLGDVDALADHENAMRDRFSDLAKGQVRQGILVYNALTLARLVHISTLFPERLPFTARILALSENRLDALDRCLR